MLFYYQWKNPQYNIHVGTTSNPGYARHFHNHIEFLFLTSGHYTAIVDEIRYDLNQGDLLLIFPYQIHEYIQTTKDNQELVFSAESGFFSDYTNILQNFIPRSPLIRAEDISQDCYNALVWLNHTNSRMDDIFNLRKSLINSIFWYAIHHVELIERKNTSMQTIQRIVKYCSEHYSDEKLSLESISHALGVSKFHISRIISHSLKVSYSTYINTLRINRACELLTNTDESITNIALDCGYGTIRNFNRVFSDYQNMTPSEFREKKQNGHKRLHSDHQNT